MSDCKRKKWFAVQLKPVGSFCNLRCDYCYAHAEKAHKSIMSELVLDSVIKKIMNQDYPYPTFSWHGGEPTMVGCNFFSHAVKLMEKYKKPGQNFYNLIQTNATLIDSKMADFFKEYNFAVSISLDGPEHIHGRHRKDQGGRNSFGKVMAGVQNLRSVGINPSVICTVSKENLSFVEETFHFLVNNGFDKIKYNPVFDSVEDNFSINNEEWFNYLKKVFDLWFDLCDPSIQIRDLDEVIAWIVEKPLNLCSSNQTCLNWISIDPEGVIYPCEYLKTDHVYGNIKDIELDEIFSTDSYKNFKTMFNYITPKCMGCEFFKFCGNGCPMIRVKDDKISFDGVYAFCEQRKRLFYEIKNAFDAFI
jgi:uncharacterized protein